MKIISHSTLNKNITPQEDVFVFVVLEKYEKKNTK